MTNTPTSGKIYSMTGFAAVELDTPQGRLNVELKSVNSRYLDLQFKLAEDLRSQESWLREKFSQSIARGKLEVRAWLNKEAAAPSLQVNADMLKALLAATAQLNQLAPNAGELRAADMLRWPGVLAEPALDQDVQRQLFQQAIDQAVTQLNASREREGARLAHVLQERIDAMQEIVQLLRPLTAQAVEHFGQKVAERLQQAFDKLGGLTHVTPEQVAERVRIEAAAYGIRVDVNEELERLTVHFAEVRRALTQGGQVGKRLDFLAQELNREANTLGSKAPSIEFTRASIDLKLLIEQLREQVQNLE